MLVVPRKNLVEGLTEAHIKKWGWRVNEKGYGSIGLTNKNEYIKMTPEIQWDRTPSSWYGNGL